MASSARRPRDAAPSTRWHHVGFHPECRPPLANAAAGAARWHGGLAASLPYVPLSVCSHLTALCAFPVLWPCIASDTHSYSALSAPPPSHTPRSSCASCAVRSACARHSHLPSPFVLFPPNTTSLLLRLLCCALGVCEAQPLALALRPARPTHLAAPAHPAPQVAGEPRLAWLAEQLAAIGEADAPVIPPQLRAGQMCVGQFRCGRPVCLSRSLVSV
eukprot:358478-Chlamydomonas_euryale.AAC.14